MMAHETSALGTLVILLVAACAACRGEETSREEISPLVATRPGIACRSAASPAQPRFRAPPRRVISLIPSATELILALGAGDHLVARTDFDRDPALARLPSVGAGLTPNLEAIAVLDPELVIAWPDNPSRSVVAALVELGAALYTPRSETLEDVFHTACGLGRLLGREAAADSLVIALQAELLAVRTATSGREPPEVLYVVWFDPPTTAGPATFVSELIGIAGGRNAFRDAPVRWPQVSLEELVRRQPHVLVVPREVPLPGLPQLRRTPGWRDLRAVREGRVLSVDGDLFNHPGPRVAEAARQLAEVLHPAALRPAALQRSPALPARTP